VAIAIDGKKPSISETTGGELLKGEVMWSLIVLIFATSSVASPTVTTLEFGTQQLCLMAARDLENLTDPVVTQGVARYKVLGSCVQTSEVVKK
jgi:hypothetical protein